MLIPALRARRRTIRQAAWRSSRSPFVSEEDRPLDPFADGQIDRPGGSGSERDSDDLAALAQHRERAVPPFEAERFDVGAERFGDTQAVDRQQGDERVLARRGQPGSDEEGADLVAVQAGGVRLVVQARPANMGRRRPLEQAFLFGVAVEAGHRAQATSDGCPSAPTGFEVPGEALDVGPAGAEQAQVVLGAPGDELAQVQRIGLTGQASVAGQERRQRVPLGVGERRVDDSDIGGHSVCRSRCTSRSGRDLEAGAARPQLHVEKANVGTICSRSTAASAGPRTHLPPNRVRARRWRGCRRRVLDPLSAADGDRRLTEVGRGQKLPFLAFLRC